MSAPADNVYRKPNGYWWGRSLNREDREFSLHTRDEKLARARYAGFYAHFEAWKRDDPYGDAGMDNPPEPMPQTTTDTAVEALHRRVEELEQKLYLAINDIDNAHDYIIEADAREQGLREALEQIERYSTEDHVKRRASAALGEKPRPIDRAPDKTNANPAPLTSKDF